MAVCRDRVSSVDVVWCHIARNQLVRHINLLASSYIVLEKVLTPEKLLTQNLLAFYIIFCIEKFLPFIINRFDLDQHDEIAVRLFQ